MEKEGQSQGMSGSLLTPSAGCIYSISVTLYGVIRGRSKGQAEFPRRMTA